MNSRRIARLTLALWALAPLAAAQLSPTTLLPGDLDPRPRAEVQSAAAVAAGAGQYLLVWEDSIANVTGSVSTGGYGTRPTDVLAVRLDADGNALDGQPIVVSQRPFDQRRVQVAWNAGANEWLVVWQSRRNTMYSTIEGIYGARVSATGAVLDDPPIVIDDTDDVNEMFPSVASDGTDWIVTWNDYEPSQSLSITRAAKVVQGGFVAFKRDLAAVSYNGYLPINVRLAYGSGQYFMTSDHSLPGQSGNLWGQFLDPATLAPGGEFRVTNGAGGRSWIATNGTDFYVSWTVSGSWSEVRGTPVSGTGTVAIPAGLLLASTYQLSDSQSHCAWDGTRWLVSVDDRTFDRIQGFYVDGAGQIEAGSPFTVDQQPATPTESIVCAGASPSGTSLVTWLDSRIEYGEQFAARVAAPGTSVVLGPVLQFAPAQTHPDLDGDLAAGYLVTYLSRAAGEHRVLAQRLDGFGVPVDAEPFVIAAGDTTLHNPRVAWNGLEWLVVWEDRISTSSSLLTATVFGRRIAPDGTLLDPAAVAIQPGNFPDVAANGLDFLVVASEEPTNHVRSIYGQRVDFGAAPLGARTLIGASYARFPSVATVSGRWLVTWQRNSTHDNPAASVRAAFVEATGGVGATVSVESSPDYAHDPAVAVVDDTALITFGSSDLRGRRMSGTGALLGDPAGFLISTAPNAQFAPAAGADGSRFLTAWTDYRIHPVLEAGVGDVYACRVEADGAVSDPAGIAVSSAFYAPEGNAAVAGDAGVALIASAVFRDGTYRIAIRTHDDRDLGTSYCGPAVPNSSGAPATIAARGLATAAANDLTLVATGLPSNQFGYFLGGRTQGFVAGPGGSQGILCLGGSIARFAGQVRNSGAAGTFTIPVDLTQIPTSPPRAVLAGDVWNFQAWFRDQNPGGTSNFSDAVSITFR